MERPRLSRKEQSPRQSEPRRSEIIDESSEEEEEMPMIKFREVKENEGRDVDEESSEESPAQEDQRHRE
jgi:hypothetical protein